MSPRYLRLLPSQYSDRMFSLFGLDSTSNKTCISLSKLLASLMQKIIINLVAAMAHRFMRDRHTDVYLKLRRLRVFLVSVDL